MTYDLAPSPLTMTDININTETESPIHRIPTEMLARIFFFTLPKTRFIRPRAADAPLLLCSVNKTWREIAFSTPTLWSSLEVGDEDLDDLSFPTKTPLSRLKIVPHWLDLSKELSVSLCIKFRSPQVTIETLTEILKYTACIGTFTSLLGKLFVPKCYDIKLSLPIIYSGTIRSTFPHKMPKLLYMQLSSLVTAEREPEDDTIAEPILSQDISDPWFPNLAVIDLEKYSASIKEVWLLLCHSPALQVGRFLIETSGSELVTPGILTLADLVNLQISITDVDVSCLFDKICTPDLQSLRIMLSIEEGVAPTLWSSFRNLLKHSMPSRFSDLQICIKGDNVGISEEELFSCLEFTPYLIDLYVTGLELSDSFLERLLIMPPTNTAFTNGSNRLAPSLTQDLYLSPLCPRLQSLTLAGKLSFSLVGIVTAIMSRALRNRNTYGLRKVDFTNTSTNSRLPTVDELVEFPDFIDCAERDLEVKLHNKLDS